MADTPARLRDLIRQFLHECGKYLSWWNIFRMSAEQAKPIVKPWQGGTLTIKPSQAQLDEMMAHHGESLDWAVKLEKTGRTLAAALKSEHPDAAKSVLTIIHRARGGGGGAEKVFPIWESVKVELERIAMPSEFVATIEALVDAVKAAQIAFNGADKQVWEQLKSLDLRVWGFMVDAGLALPLPERNSIHKHLGNTRIPYHPFGIGRFSLFATEDWLQSMDALKVQAERIALMPKADDPDDETKGKRRGRRKASYETIQHEAGVAARWKRAKEASVQKVDAAKSEGMKLADFDRLLERVAKREKTARQDKSDSD